MFSVVVCLQHYSSIIYIELFNIPCVMNVVTRYQYCNILVCRTPSTMVI